MASPASMITCGDLDNDGTDDLIGIWAGQGGVWVKYSSTGELGVSSARRPSYIGAGDMNGDGRDELLGSWTGRESITGTRMTGAWVQMASEATMITSGDLEGDGTDDLLGIWPSQGGVWVKYSSTGGWELSASTAQYIAAGKMRPVPDRRRWQRSWPSAAADGRHGARAGSRAPEDGRIEHGSRRLTIRVS